MAKKFRGFVKGILLRAETSDPSDNSAGSIWYNSTANVLKSYLNSAIRILVTTDQSQTLENKTIDGTNATGNNTVSIDASDATYSNATSGLVATNVQTAIDEVEGRVDSVESGKVSGPASATDNAVVRYDSTTGKLVQNSGVTIDDSNNITGAAGVSGSGGFFAGTSFTANAAGTDLSSEGKGLTIERVGPNGSFIYADAATSKFKIGASGGEVEVADISSSQTFTNKSLSSASNTVDATKLQTVDIDTTTPTTGQLVRYNGTKWAPWTLSVQDGNIDSEASTSGYVLTSNGASGASWAAPASNPAAGLTSGSILFSDGANGISENNANFYWDTTNKRLGIGTNSITNLDIGIKIDGGTGRGQILMEGDTTADLVLGDTSSAVDDKYMMMRNESGITKFLSLTDGFGVTKDSIIVMDHGTGFVGFGTAPGASQQFLVYDQASTVTFFEIQTNGHLFANGINQTTASGLPMEYFASTGEIYAETSDARMKKNIRNMESCLDKICSLQGVVYNSKTKEELRDTTISKEFVEKNSVINDDVDVIGLLAQDVEKIFPEVVVYGKDEHHPMGINYSKLVPALIESVKELKKEINEIRNMTK